MDVRIIPSGDISDPAKPTQLRPLTKTRKAAIDNSQVTSLADDLPFDGAFLFSDDPLAYVS